MRKKRTWSTEEKLNILKEGKENGPMKACRKHGLYAATYYSWKEKFESGEFGPGGKIAKRQTKEYRKLEKENALLKRILADKELELAMAKDVIKKKTRIKRS